MPVKIPSRSLPHISPLAGVVGLVLFVSPVLQAQPVMGRVFPAAEFAERRAGVMRAIGDGVAVLEGTTERPGEQPLRQNDEFYYLTGVVEPRAILVIDGRSKRSTLFLSPTTPLRERSMFGPSLTPGDSAEKDTASSQWCYAISSAPCSLVSVALREQYSPRSAPKCWAVRLLVIRWRSRRRQGAIPGTDASRARMRFARK